MRAPEAGGRREPALPPRSGWAWGAAAVMLAGAALRVAAARGDLWQDEIWSLYFAEHAGSPLGVFGFRHDNNHLLNTLWLFAVGEQSPFVYRLPALAAGIAGVATAGLLARSWGRAEALAALVLTASSALLVQYDSEARGYAPAVLCLWLCVLAVERARRAPAPGWAVLFSAGAAVGALCHLSFASAYGALLCWWLWIRRGGSAPPAGRLREFLRWHALPLAVLGGLGAFFLRGMQLGGGGRDPASVGAVLLETLALAVGVTPRGPLVWLGAALFAAALAAGLREQARRGSDRLVLYAAGIAILPALTLALRTPEYTAPRYYLLSVALFLLLLAELCGSWLRGRGPRRAAGTVLLVAFAAGNAALLAPLLRHGRGQYSRALHWIAAHTPGDTISLGSDHAFRNGWIVDHYAPRLALGRRLRFYRKRDWPERGPDWYIAHRLGWSPEAPETLEDHRGHRYRLEARFPSGPLSGMHWYVYRRDDDASRR